MLQYKICDLVRDAIPFGRNCFKLLCAFAFIRCGKSEDIDSVSSQVRNGVESN